MADVPGFRQTLVSVDNSTELIGDLSHEVNGNFIFTDRCATPGGLLYVRDDQASKRIYHIKHVEPGKATDKDLWVITDNIRKLEPDQHRSIVMAFDKGYSHPCGETSFDSARHIQAHLPGAWAPLSLGVQISVTEKSPHSNVELNDFSQQTWEPDSCGASEPAIQLRLNVKDIYFPTPSLPVIWNGAMVGGEEPWVPVADHRSKEALELVAYALNKVTPEEGHRLAVDGVRLSLRPDEECSTCPVGKSQIHNVINDDGTIDRYEDQQAAVEITRNENNRKPPFNIEAWLQQSYCNSSPWLLLNMRIDINPMSLIHRALGYITRDATAMSAACRSAYGTGSFQVQFAFRDPSLKSLVPFSQSLQPTSSINHANKIQPPSFPKNLRLRDDQLAAVNWMLERESGKDGFTEIEIEETLLPSVNVRMYGVAQVQNCTRGGVLAHDIGYGKTIITLALIDYKLGEPQDTIESINERYRLVNGNRLLHLKATLVIVPHHIITQWASEARRFLGSKRRIHVIRKATDIEREKLIMADVIIVSTVGPTNDKAMTALAGAAGLPKLAKGTDRSKQEWYCAALETLRNVGFDFQNPDTTSEEELRRRLDNLRLASKSIAEEAALNNVGPSSRKAQLTTTSKGSKEPTKEQQAAAATATNSQEEVPKLGLFKTARLLQMCTFRRVVYDEFSYENFGASLFFQNVIASSKWILSGTPPTGSLGQLCKIGSLINSHVARVAPTPGYFPYVTNGPEVAELTQGEEFLAFRDCASAQFALERHQQGQRFVEHFFRKNETDVSDIPVIERIVLSTLNPQETIIYNLVQQALRDAMWHEQGVSGYFAHLIVNTLSNEKGSRAGQKVTGSKESAYASTIDALNILASVSASYNAFKWIPGNQAVTANTITTGSNMRGMAYFNHCKETLASLIDLMMFLANIIKQDNSPRDDTRSKREAAYMEHMQKLIANFRAADGGAFGDVDCMRNVRETVIHKKHINGANYRYVMPRGRLLWDAENWAREKGGPGRYDQTDWWKMKDVDDVLDEEVSGLMHHLPHISPDDPIDKKDFVRQLGALQDDPRKRKRIASAVGLKKTDINEDMDKKVENFFKAKDEDVKETKETKKAKEARENKEAKNEAKNEGKAFEFGVKLSSKRPKVNTKHTVRSSLVDQTLDCFMLVIQSIESGIMVTADAWRRSLFAMKACLIMHRNLEAYGGFAVECNKCSNQINDLNEGFLSVACGHTLCSTCFTGFNSLTSERCPSQGGCTAMSRSTFIPWSMLIHDLEYNLNDDLAAEPSSKVKSVHNVIQNEIAPYNEKVLIFAAYNGIKIQLREFLTSQGLAVYLTNGAKNDPEQIEAFKNHKGTAVLIQSLMSAESAGTNLVEANHVMFAGALSTDTVNYDMYMRQAKGRAVRQGQTRGVIVYHFVSLGTLEFDAMNRRLKGKLTDWGEIPGRVDLPLADPAPVSPHYPIMFRPFVNEVQSERLLSSVEFEEFEME
ncbi:hypothetical protein K4K60_009800 [Colletotrichum sp. SAR11_57]|nr:hypothetical protein K4K60_009800 [Colletotrichum sp. SAR11_57]